MYLEACLETLNVKRQISESSYHLNFEIFYIHTELHLCALLSHMNKHSKALKHSKNAYINYKKLISSTITGVYDNSLCFPQDQANIITNILQIHDFLSNLPILNCTPFNNLPWISCKLSETFEISKISMINISEINEITTEISADLVGKLLTLGVSSIYSRSIEEKNLHKSTK